MRIARNENGDLMFYGSPFGNPAAAFRAVKAGPTEVVFVNPNHEYPQRIRYWMEGDMLLAEGLERAGRELTRGKLRSALASLRSHDMGGMTVDFSGGAPYVGSRFVDLGILGANGRVVG